MPSEGGPLRRLPREPAQNASEGCPKGIRQPTKSHNCTVIGSQKAHPESPPSQTKPAQPSPAQPEPSPAQPSPAQKSHTSNASSSQKATGNDKK